MKMMRKILIMKILKWENKKVRSGITFLDFFLMDGGGGKGGGGGGGGGNVLQ